MYFLLKCSRIIRSVELTRAILIYNAKLELAKDINHGRGIFFLLRILIPLLYSGLILCKAFVVFYVFNLS